VRTNNVQKGNHENMITMEGF